MGMYAFLDTLIQVMLVIEVRSLLLDCTFIGENLVTWRSKKQDVVSCSSAEAEYRAMTHTACEMVWLKNLLIDLGFRQPGPMPMSL